MKWLGLSLGIALLASPTCGETLVVKDGITFVSLKALGSFSYEVPDSYNEPMDAWAASEKKSKAKPKIPKRKPVPAWVKKLDNAKVAVPGFMVPFDIEEDGVLSFSIVKNMMVCCYGLVPNVNENILCEMPKGKKAAFYINVPIRVYGTLHVGEVTEDGYVLSLYRMTVDKIEKIENPDSDLMQGASQIPAALRHAVPTRP